MRGKLDSSGSGWDPQRDDVYPRVENSGSIKSDQFLDWLSDCPAHKEVFSK